MQPCSHFIFEITVSYVFSGADWRQVEKISFYQEKYHAIRICMFFLGEI
jgi:hypothetical protein